MNVSCYSEDKSFSSLYHTFHPLPYSPQFHRRVCFPFIYLHFLWLRDASPRGLLLYCPPKYDGSREDCLSLILVVVVHGLQVYLLQDFAVLWTERKNKTFLIV